MVSIHRPLGYGPSTLPLRHAALVSKLLLTGIPEIIETFFSKRIEIIHRS